MTNKKRPTGYLLLETPNIVIVATIKTHNPKTGNMVQLWILNRDVDPVTATKTGADDVVCFDCPHRGTIEVLGDDGTTRNVGRTCYVRVVQAPLAVWRAYRAGKYPALAPDGYRAVFQGRKIRFGAYGEPVLIPLHIVSALATVSDGWTGYTHQWRHAEYDAYRRYFMASCDNPHDYIEAKTRGWRTFRVRSADESMRHSEIICPASDEADHKTTCETCKLCAGTTGADDPRKDIAIIVHGSGARNFQTAPTLIQISL
jgi:hypothetical protein